MELNDAQKATFIYETFLQASKEPDLRPADGATLLAQVQGWKGGLFLDSLQKVAQQRQLQGKRPTGKNLMRRLFQK
ncbi:hypothetical protein [Hymenobacter properus]|uniref:Uncharacterized protein n=1 Tax=Hymenobacter properus TaxID=2791026 RepID=A0A931FKB9_9BACT|nr:hypothetical protein [Hymenobacter properus]MBF9140836.1 hypothetical protein [Hymenobacter properus]MBR7719645.1 hypothetical protein [Microvirga sp. SRT04]